MANDADESEVKIDPDLDSNTQKGLNINGPDVVKIDPDLSSSVKFDQTNGNSQTQRVIQGS